jgi:CBS domain-containing protein
LLLSDTFDQKQHGVYFEQLTRFVCDGLNECFHFYRTGELMAVTEKWRQPITVWKNYFSEWIDQPDSERLLQYSPFFDLRLISGDQELFSELKKHLLFKSAGSQAFLSVMAGNALTNRPPLGFFRNLVLIQGGEHDSTFDMKHSGVVPIVDLTRVYALAAGVNEVNTQDRIRAIADAGVIAQDIARDLEDTFEFVSFLRIRHQARQIRDGRAANNYMSPENLSNFERSHLKDAFSVIRTMQTALVQRYKA